MFYLIVVVVCVPEAVFTRARMNVSIPDSAIGICITKAVSPGTGIYILGTNRSVCIGITKTVGSRPRIYIIVSNSAIGIGVTKTVCPGSCIDILVADRSVCISISETIGPRTGVYIFAVRVCSIAIPIAKTIFRTTNCGLSLNC